jgi:protein arginine kinase
MVLQSMRKPAWLSEDAPHGDVVLSSRTRLMRNLKGHRFPNAADEPELMQVMNSILDSAREAHPSLEVFKGLTNAERDYLVGCRLVSLDFEWTLPGRALLVDPERSISLMVNEEDHLRIQALSAGWSILNCEAAAAAFLDSLEARLNFAYSPDFGYLSASPFNCGAGRRQSSMFHLIGLAHQRRLPSVIKALGVKGIAVRGLFGESSRAVGAFVQVSVIGGTQTEFSGACEYLLNEERAARRAVGRETLLERAQQAQEFAIGCPTISLADALRVLAWLRWAACDRIEGFRLSPRDVDATLATLELRVPSAGEASGRQRADSLRTMLQAEAT